MKRTVKIIILIIFCGSLVACLNNKDDGNKTDLNNQNQALEEQNNTNQNSEVNVNTDVEDNAVNESNNVEANEDDSETENENNAEKKVVIENDVFKVFEPAPKFEVKENITVRGLASVFEGNVNYEFEDGHFIMDEGFVTASEGAPEWGEFEFSVNIDGAVNGSASVILFEISAKDGSRINELIIPVKINK